MSNSKDFAIVGPAKKRVANTLNSYWSAEKKIKTNATDTKPSAVVTPPKPQPSGCYEDVKLDEGYSTDNSSILEVYTMCLQCNEKIGKGDNPFVCDQCDRWFHWWCMPDIDHHQNCCKCKKNVKKYYHEADNNVSEDDNETDEDDNETDNTDSTNWKEQKAREAKIRADGNNSNNNDDSNDGSNYTTWPAYLKKWGHLIDDWGWHSPTPEDIANCNENIVKFGPNAACFRSNKKNRCVFCMPQLSK